MAAEVNVHRKAHLLWFTPMLDVHTALAGAGRNIYHTYLPR